MLTWLDVRLPSLEPDRSYLIYIDPDAGAERRLADAIVKRAQVQTVGLVTDETVAMLHWERIEAALRAAGLNVTTVVVPDGEKSKSLARAETVAEAFVRGGLDRRSLVMALGGGVVGDLGGFVASVFLRGVPYVQVPTTLLAQVDSSVGGKTGVNLPSGKNLVGTFHQPLLVYADLSTLTTLSPRDVSAGLAEIVKHAVIADAELLTQIEARAEDARDPVQHAAFIGELVRRSCAIKAEIVSSDERELLTDAPGGGRARLNFGHTVGHALESASASASSAGDDGPLRHGEAVGLGMLAAARLGAALGVGDRALEGRLLALLPRLGLPVDLDRRLNAATLERVKVDKKRTGGLLQLVVVDRLGSSQLYPIAPERLGEILLSGKTK
jgi:3-dehydroquinate synthase